MLRATEPFPGQTDALTRASACPLVGQERQPYHRRRAARSRRSARGNSATKRESAVGADLAGPGQYQKGMVPPAGFPQR
jgi:hypothetical protein